MQHNWIVSSESNLQHMRVCNKCGLEWKYSFCQDENPDSTCAGTRNWRTAVRRLLKKNDGDLTLHFDGRACSWQELLFGVPSMWGVSGYRSQTFTEVIAVEFSGDRCDPATIWTPNTIYVINMRDLNDRLTNGSVVEIKRNPDECSFVWQPSN